MSNREETHIESEQCVHCGDVCAGSPIYGDAGSFCCTGCKTAYQIIQENGLCAYYDIETNPGVSLKDAPLRKRFDYLEDPDVVAQIIDFQNNNRSTVTFRVPNIHCSSCIWLLENLQKLDEGVLSSNVNFLKREIHLHIDTEKTSLRNVVETMANIGYEPEIQLDKLYEKKSSGPDYSIWLKLGVAGFSFGNIMLFSFPEYLNVNGGHLETEFRIIFGGLNILLALPVLFYSSSDYLKSAFAAVRQGGINLDVPISIGILALFGRSVYEIVSGTGAGYMDSFTGLIFFLLIGKVIQKKTFERLSFDRDYRSYLPIAVHVMQEGGEERSQSIDRLDIGQKIRLRNQELVPSDSILLTDEAYIDYSFITGESDPELVKKGSVVFAGGRLTGTSAELMVNKKVENSYLTKLWNNEAFQHSDKELSLTTFADRISPYFTYSVLAVALAAALYWMPAGAEQSLSVFTAVLIIACPCALALSTPFTLGSALNILSLNGLFVKNSLLLESLSASDTMVFDKTGTLTNAESTDIRFSGDGLTYEVKSWVKSLSLQSVHPVSKKISRYFEDVPSVQPHSFHEAFGQGIFATFGDVLVCIGSRSFILEQSTLDESDIPKVPAAGTVTHLCIDNQYLGYFLLGTGLRDGLKPLLKELKSNFETFLISGDNDSQQKQLEPFFSDGRHLLFNQKPEEKLAFIKELQQKGKKVTMIGDGLNDAGALKKSNFGIALSDDISAFSPACDAILEGNALKNLSKFISFSQKSMNIILMSFALSLAYNVIGLSFAVTGQLSPLVAAILMPLSSVSIMVFTFLMTRYKAKKMELSIWK